MGTHRSDSRWEFPGGQNGFRCGHAEAAEAFTFSIKLSHKQLSREVSWRGAIFTEGSKQFC